MSKRYCNLEFCCDKINLDRDKIKGANEKMNKIMAESLVGVHTHTHTSLLENKINKFDIEKAHRLSI